MVYKIVGGGLAGLTAAVALAKRGARVELFEKRRELGGRAASSSKNGFTFNFGPHALYRHGVTMKTLTAWGIAPTGGVPDVSRAGYFIRDGERFTIPLGIGSLLTSRLLSPSEKLEFGQAYRRLTSQTPASASGQTVAQWLAMHVSKERVRQMLFALIRVGTYSNDAESLSMAAAMRQAQLGVAGGVLYLDGGWQTIVDSLAALARNSGVRIRTSETISALTANTILAIPPGEVELLTGKALPPRKPLGMGSLDLALKQVPAGAAHFALGLDRPLYFSMHSQWARLAPEGAALVQVGRYLIGDEQASRTELEAFCDVAMPGWRSLVTHARFLPNLAVAHAMPELTPRAPGIVPGLNSVYIAGDWVGPEGMLADTATASALAAASRLLERRAAA